VIRKPVARLGDLGLIAPWSEEPQRAGGGVKGGIVEGATNEVGYRAVEKRHYISDLQATILHQLGLNYKKVDFILNGRPLHFIEEGDGPTLGILS
jgi:hypothetical protein